MDANSIPDLETFREVQVLEARARTAMQQGNIQLASQLHARAKIILKGD